MNGELEELKEWNHAAAAALPDGVRPREGTRGIMAREATWLFGSFVAAGSPVVIYRIYLMVTYGDLNPLLLLEPGLLRTWFLSGLTFGPVLYFLSGVVRSTIWSYRNIRRPRMEQASLTRPSA